MLYVEKKPTIEAIKYTESTADELMAMLFRYNVQYNYSEFSWPGSRGVTKKLQISTALMLDGDAEELITVKDNDYVVVKDTPGKGRQVSIMDVYNFHKLYEVVED